jgi:hypothetical protein
METKDDLLSAIKNCTYYIEKIEEITTQQLDIDMHLKVPNGKELNTNSLALRFACESCIIADCASIKFYFKHIGINVGEIEKQDKKLFEAEAVVVPKVNITEVDLEAKSNAAYASLDNELGTKEVGI